VRIPKINPNGHDLPPGFRRIVSEITGKVTFEVCAGKLNGIKIRRQFGEVAFGSEAVALAAARNWMQDKKAEIKSDRSAVLGITDRDRLVYSEALERLKPFGKTLLQAVNTAIAVYKEEVGMSPMTMRDASARFLEHKGLENCRQSYLDNAKTSMNAILERFGNKLVSQVTTDDLQAWLLKRNISPVTWNNWRRDLRVFFNFCINEPNRWTKSNPAAAIAIKKTDDEEVTVLTVDQARKVLRSAIQSCARQIPWLALGMFAGLRRNEADAAQWEDIDWDQSVIKVRSTKVRSASSRYVHLADAAKEFLSLFKGESGPIATGPYARRDDLKKLSEATGIDCVSNIYRHSFGSYYLAMHQDQAATMFQMGHQNAKTFMDWYRKPVPGIVAHAYWAIRSESLR
jgi:integrase